VEGDGKSSSVEDNQGSGQAAGWTRRFRLCECTEGIADVPISTYLGNKILDHVLTNTAYTSPATVYLSLHTGDPGLTGASEATGGSYARQACAFDAAASKATQNAAAESFTGMPAATITHVGLWDAVSAGNFLWGGALAASKTTNSGDTFTIADSDLDVSLT
jgi:hypothetical protein